MNFLSKKLQMRYNKKCFVVGLPWICANWGYQCLPAQTARFQLCFLSLAMVSASLMGCGILFQAFGAVYKSFFWYVLILT